jgi:ribosomal protein S18 acetylase RimI-like enzyme
MPKAAHCESDLIGVEPEVNSKPSMTIRSDSAAILRQSLMNRVPRAQAGLIGLRPAVAADESFLYRVYASTREVELQLFDWNDDQKTAFLTMQFGAQRLSYRQSFPGWGYDIIAIGDQPVGRFFVHRGADAIRVVDLGLLPEYRSQGIGSALLKAVLEEADEAGMPIRLHVESFNRAMKLYERLGFRAVRINGIHVEMECAPRIALE